MTLKKTYNPHEVEPRLQKFWQEAGIYQFDPQAEGPVYSIDTPPPTVSGNLHLGHTFSYTHPDLFARFQRMQGRKVFYPMGYDDNGLPTERLVEKRLGIRAPQIGRGAFIQKCLEIGVEVESDYQALWQRLGLSIDWRYTYRTIDENSRRVSQRSFIDLCRKGLAYRREAPAIWCPECQTSIAQADLNDLERESEFVTLFFPLETAGEKGEGGRGGLSIATTRPELLPACVAVFVHPEDARHREWIGKSVQVPLFGQGVPVLADPAADPEKGTGAVMCCTFGDTADVTWWHTHHLPLVEAIDRSGRMTAAAGPYAGLSLAQAREQIKLDLESEGFLLGRQPTRHSLRVHERCDTPVEYIVTRQWFIRVLDFKEMLLQAGEEVRWHPEHMGTRYRAWVENLNWDWCISRQRFFGVPFPAWYCQTCGETILASEDQLPVDPAERGPDHACPKCGGEAFIPEADILDTWATSSMTPQIVGRWLDDGSQGKSSPEEGGETSFEGLYERVFPFSLRPQAHDIIRAWAFYTILKSEYHFDALPWRDVLISGWGIAGEGMGKISKSRGGGPMPPMEMIARYSADAVRYWAASTSPGKDAVISEEKIQVGARLATKLWNVARFAEKFLEDKELGNKESGDQASGNRKQKSGIRNQVAGAQLPETQLPYPQSPITLSPIPFSLADRWILSRLQKLIRRVTELMEGYDYAAAKSEIESFFWQELADNYLEMAKQRLYDESSPLREGARYSLRQVLMTVLKLLAPFLPHVTEEIYQGLENRESRLENGQRVSILDYRNSIHTTHWPEADPRLENEAAEAVGQRLVEIATAVRRYKSERNLPLSTELDRLQLAIVEGEGEDSRLATGLQEASLDLMSITRARLVQIVSQLEPGLTVLQGNGPLQIALEEGSARK